jgi:hypothetical protein
MTSLEIFNKKIELNSIQLLDGFLTFTEYMQNINSIFNECKILHEKEIIDAYIDGNYKSNRDMYWKKEDAKKYYNEKYEN